MILLQNQYDYYKSFFVSAQILEVMRFANQEVYIKDQTKGHERVFVVGSLVGQDEDVLGLLRALHYFGALQKRVCFFTPYFGYQRQDKELHGAAWASALIAGMGNFPVVAFELHNEQAQGISSFVQNISMHQIFYDFFAHYIDRKGFSVVFPDQGAYETQAPLFSGRRLGWFAKNRNSAGVVLGEFQGEVSKKVCLVDDILDSGQTLVQACMRLKEMGVEEIVIFVAHGFFYGHVWNDLWQLGVTKLYCTDSLPNAINVKHPLVEVVPLFSKITLEKIFGLSI